MSPACHLAACLPRPVGNSIPSFASDVQSSYNFNRMSFLVCHTEFCGQLHIRDSSSWLPHSSSVLRNASPFRNTSRDYAREAFSALPFVVHSTIPGQAGQAKSTVKEKKYWKKRSASANKKSDKLGENCNSLSQDGIGSPGISDLILQTNLASAIPAPVPEQPTVGDRNENGSGQSKDTATEAGQLDWQNGNPLGRKVIGKNVVKWILRGMDNMAAVIVEAEQRGDVGTVAERMPPSGLAFVALAQPYMSETPMPQGSEALCLKASMHYPTLFDHFQRSLQSGLQALQEKGLLENWENSEAWKLLKKRAKSDDHRAVARQAAEPKMIYDELGLTRDMVSEIQQRVDAYVAKAFELLKIERDVELDATQHSLDAIPSASVKQDSKAVEQILADDDGHPECCDTIRNLTAVSSSTGLGGMHLVTFSVKGGDRLPPTTMSPGDMVCVRISDRKGAGATECMRGSVYSFGDNGSSISVAVEARYGDPTFSRLFGRSLRIDRISDLADATTYQRDCEALDRLQKCGLQKKNVSLPVVATLFGIGPKILSLAQKGLVSSHNDKPSVMIVYDEDFDKSQHEAIGMGVCKHRPVVVIQGPPGTGKTRVVVEIIKQAVKQGEKVLATAPTNAAVDNLVERLALAGLNVVRVGNPSRVAPAVVAKSLSFLVDSKLSAFRRDLARRRADLRSDMRECLGDESMEVGFRQMLKQLSKSLKEKEKEVVDEILKLASVVLCTNTGAGDPLVRQVAPFDMVVIDEAGQAIEPSCWIPLLQGRRAVLAGDIHQLAPTILSRQAMEGGLGVSLMERASGLHGGILGTMLTVQYRMHEVIASWASAEMYGGLLTSSPVVSSHLLSDTPGVQATWLTHVPLLLLDTRLPYGSLIVGCEECMDPAGTGSFYNEGEADIVAKHVTALLSAGVVPETIAVQSPYLAQVQLLQDRIYNIQGALGVQVASVDSFQGREADAVVISMVRSNKLGVVGFLGDSRRMNVAVTRARKHVTLVCDSTTVCRNDFLRRLLQHIRQFGEVTSAGSQGESSGGFLMMSRPRP